MSNGSNGASTNGTSTNGSNGASMNDANGTAPNGSPSASIDPRSKGWLRRLVGYVMRRRNDVAVALFAAVLGAACQAGAPLLERQIVDG
ncbi:MAG TPA: hypothetical protein VH268_10880, partial [Solirubrobacterales bacterium]|nr:hypothetical protein [Solirubrobacterales bacterium]